MDIKQYTLVIPHTPLDMKNGHRVLLGMKKRGFGVGKWNGFGGKVEPQETVHAAATRELREECGLVANDLTARGIIMFEFVGQSTLLEVHVFSCSLLVGDPVESDEMQPHWFDITQIPFESMWKDDALWFPFFFANKSFVAHILFRDTETLLVPVIKELSSNEFDSMDTRKHALMSLVLAHSPLAASTRTSSNADK